MSKDMKPPITEDVLIYFCWKASKSFGALNERFFTNAGLSNVITKELSLKKPIDGMLIRLILEGRWWVKRAGECRYQFIEESP